MNHAADAEQSWRRDATIGLIAALCGLLAACGSGAAGPVASGPSPTPPGPSAPGPSPSPTQTNFLHVLQGDSVATYRIDDATGRLQLSVTQAVEDAHALTGEPGGRFVYAAHANTSDGRARPVHRRLLPGRARETRGPVRDVESPASPNSEAHYPPARVGGSGFRPALVASMRCGTTSSAQPAAAARTSTLT